MKSVNFKSGEKDFTLAFSMLKPSQSLKFLLFMAKVIGAPAAKVVGAVQGKATSLEELMNLGESEINLERIGEAIFGLFDRMDEDEVILKLDLLFSSVSIGGVSVHVDHPIFDGDPLLIFKVVKEAVGVNYSRFLEGSSGLLSKLSKSAAILQKSKSLRPEQM